MPSLLDKIRRTIANPRRARYVFRKMSPHFPTATAVPDRLHFENSLELFPLAIIGLVRFPAPYLGRYIPRFRRSSVAKMAASAEKQPVPEAQNAPADVNSQPRKKLLGREFYKSIGSPKYIVAPMVDRSEFVILSSIASDRVMG